MKIMNSIWLVPQENDKQYLQKIINQLSTEYNAPSFIPHLTLFPEINIPLNDIKKIIDEVFSNQKPFEIEKIGINQSDNFWKTIYLEFTLNDALENLFKKMSTKTDQRDISVFNPHISLFYKTLPEEERLKISKSIETKNKFIIDKVIINAPKDGDEDFLDIPNWQNPFTKKI